MKHLVLFCCSLLLPFLLSAQFFINGSAISFGDTCFQLTDAVRNFQAGSVWHAVKIDLRESFKLIAQVNLGCQDETGADGIVFGLQPLSTSIGIAGGDIGFGGVMPALGVEIDTYQNFDLGDPAYDHLAIIRDGNLNHNTADGALAGPVQARINERNIEDCNFYSFMVNWNAADQRLDVYFDCILRLSYQGDLIQDIFNGDPLVFWGFTSATGGLNNIQQVCINYATFLDQMEDRVMCPAGQILLEVAPGFNYIWQPADGLSDPTIHNPIASPDTTTIYTVEIFDDCAFSFFDEVTVTVAGDSTLIDLGRDSILCAGDRLQLDATTIMASYQWSTTETTPFIFVENAGEYRVTVTRTDVDCVVEDKILIASRPRPFVDLGSDTTLCLEQSLLLDVSFPEASYRWQDGSDTDFLLIENAGSYQLTLTHPCGIVFDELNVAYENCHDVYLPNVFSPNLDGINDVFFPMSDDDVVLIHRLQIFDRWGNLVFEQTNFLPNISSLGWRGEWRGKTAQQGLYIWQLDVSFKDGSREERAGELYLIK